MKIKFLGTGSGKTSLKRHHSSFLISSGNHNLLVDCGDGISSAILKQNISFPSIDSILILHLHADHFSGLASLVTQMKLVKRIEPLSIYVHSSNLDFVEDYLLHSYLFRERMGFELTTIPFEVDNEVRVTESLVFNSRSNSHLDKYLKYNIKNDLSFISLSFLLKDQQSSLIYSGDIGSEKDLYIFEDKADWFVTEISHIKLEDVMILLERNQCKRIILTHIDDESEKLVDHLLNSLKTEQKSRIIAAYDGLEL